MGDRAKNDMQRVTDKGLEKRARGEDTEEGGKGLRVKRGNRRKSVEG